MILYYTFMYDSDWMRGIWKKSISPAESLEQTLSPDGTWQRVILLNDGWYSKKQNIDCTEFMPARFIIDSNWLRMTVWIYRVRNTNTNVHFIFVYLIYLLLKETKRMLNSYGHSAESFPRSVTSSVTRLFVLMLSFDTPSHSLLPIGRQWIYI